MREAEREAGGGHDDQPACRGSQNNSNKQGGGEAELSCAGLHARPKDWAFQNQCAHLDSICYLLREAYLRTLRILL